MTHPLTGCRARQQRAALHYRVMEEELAGLPDKAKAFAFRSDFNRETNEVHVYLDKVPDFPSRWGLIASEAFFNARAALDYLAWELARWNLRQQGQSRDPYDRTQFPIATCPSDFYKSRTMLKDLHPDHRSAIELFQPYGREALSKFLPGQVNPDSWRDLANKVPLARLALVNNHDKHRMLRPIASGTRESTAGYVRPLDCLVVGAAHSTPRILHKGAAWSTYRVLPTGPNPGVESRDRIKPDVAFGDYNFLSEFPGILAEVNEVVEHFVPVFGTDPLPWEYHKADLMGLMA